MRLPRITVLILAVAVAACGARDKDVQLTRFKNEGNGPNEFAIMPGKPLETPADYSTLPPPTPGAANLTDQNPLADGVAALGGNPAALTPTGISSSETALVRHVGRFGTPADIRQTVAQEDLDIRRRHGRVNILNLGPIDDYTNAYKRQWLDANNEAQRLRNLGIATPSFPPPKR